MPLEASLNQDTFLENYSATVKEAIKEVNDFLNLNHNNNLVFHNFQHSIALLQNIDAITAQESSIDHSSKEAAQIAAIFYNLGFAKNPEDPIASAINSANAFLERNPLSSSAEVESCLRALGEGAFANSEAEKLIQDAFAAHELANTNENSNPIQRMEAELLAGKKISSLEWNESRLNKFLSSKFHFPYSKIHFEPIIAERSLEFKQKVERNKLNGPKGWELDQVRNFQSLERRIPNSGNQTFFRTNYRNHINLSAIADNKANIMISVNAIVLSVLISVLSYRNITETNPKVLMPIVIFLATGLTSLIFAVLSARPKVTRINTGKRNLEDFKKNITFFGNFVNLSLEQYEEAMDAMLRDSELVYGNMTRDLYHLGKVLDQKYRYLTISYNVFMVGFAATVLTFMVAFFS